MTGMIPHQAKHKREAKGALTGTIYGDEIADGVIGRGSLSVLPVQLTITTGNTSATYTDTSYIGSTVYSYHYNSTTVDATAGSLDARIDPTTGKVDAYCEAATTGNVTLTVWIIKTTV